MNNDDFNGYLDERMEQAVENLEVWSQESETPKKHISDSVRYSGLSQVDPQYQALRCTMRWGPCGIGWGVKVIDHGFVMVSPSPIFWLHASFWYVQNGQTFHIEQMVEEVVASGNNAILKQCMTQVRSKALSLLGFSADVFMGDTDREPQGKPIVENGIERGALEKIRKSKLSEVADYHKSWSEMLEAGTQDDDMFRRLIDAAEKRLRESGL